MEGRDDIHTEGETFQDAVAAASAQLGLKSTELAIEIIDPGASAQSSTGFRPVRIRAWRRDPDASADGLKKPAPGAPRRSIGAYDDGGRRSSHGPATIDNANESPIVEPIMAIDLVRCCSRVRSAAAAIKAAEIAPAPCSTRPMMTM